VFTPTPTIMFSIPSSQPSTPTSSSTHLHYPHTSSPLSASPSPSSSAASRRQWQHKPTAPLLSSRRSSAAYSKRVSNSSPNNNWDGSFMRGNLFNTKADEDASHRSLLRERFKQRCFERAQRAREAKIKSGRKHAHYSSEGEDFDMDEDEDEGEDEFINDAVSGTIQSASLAPNLETPASFSHELCNALTASYNTSIASPFSKMWALQ
jgi:hypothetical protein